MKNKTHKNKKEIKSLHDDNDDVDYGGIKIKKIIIKDNVGCITVDNSFEENFKNYLNNKPGEPNSKKKSVSVSVSEPEPEASSLISDPSSPKPIIDFTLLNVSFLGVCSSLSLFAFSSSEPESEACSNPYSNSFAG